MKRDIITAIISIVCIGTVIVELCCELELQTRYFITAYLLAFILIGIVLWKEK